MTKNEDVIKISKNKNVWLVKCSGTFIDTNWLIIPLVDVRTKLSLLVYHDHWQKMNAGSVQEVCSTDRIASWRR